MTSPFTEAPAPDRTWALTVREADCPPPITLAPPGRPRFYSFNPTLSLRKLFTWTRGPSPWRPSGQLPPQLPSASCAGPLGTLAWEVGVSVSLVPAARHEGRRAGGLPPTGPQGLPSFLPTGRRWPAGSPSRLQLGPWPLMEVPAPPSFPWAETTACGPTAAGTQCWGRRWEWKVWVLVSLTHWAECLLGPMGSGIRGSHLPQPPGKVRGVRGALLSLVRFN